MKKKKKKTGKKNAKNDEEILDEVRKGNFIQDWHLKVGSLAYAAFFALLIFAITRRSIWGFMALVSVYIAVLWGIHLKYRDSK